MLQEKLTVYLSKINADPRITVWHLGIYNALIQIWLKNNQEPYFHITRKKVMLMSRIKSAATYHKYMADLHQYGYIHYFPSYNPYIGSGVGLI